MTASDISHPTDYFARIDRWSKTEIYHKQLVRLLGALEVNSNHRILDVGCGTGEAIRITSRTTGASPFGVEPAESAYQFLGGLEVRRSAADSLPFEAGSFDRVLLLHVIGHLVDPGAALREIFRVLKPGGRLGIITPNIHFVRLLSPLNRIGWIPHRRDETILRAYSRRGLQQELENAGFCEMRCWYEGHPPEYLGRIAKALDIPFMRQRVFAVAVKPVARSEG